MELVEGAWEGQSAVIVGGGPSLKGFKWEALKKRKNIITINRAFIDVPWADIWFTEDARVITDLWGAKLREFRGLKVWHCLEKKALELVQATDPSIKIIETKRQDKFWSRSFEQGLCYSSNSGVGAINIAYLLGVDKIYLLGFDCRASGERMGNYHNDYKKDPMWEVGTNAADNFKSDFENWVELHMRRAGVRVVNVVNPAFESTIECWPKISQEEFCRVW